MDDATKLKTAIGLIITGLYEKERKKIPGEYYYSKRLIHGINIFQSLNYKYNRKNFDFSDMHEQCFIEKYAMEPVGRWFEGWKNTDELKLESQFFYSMDALVEDSGFRTFHLNENCEDYIEYFEKDLIAGVEQRAVYEGLMLLEQTEYAALRKFLIEHPIVKGEELRALKRKYSQNEVALQVLGNAYEDIKEDYYVCKKCGWTLRQEATGMRCQSRSCTEEKYIRGELQRVFGETGMLRLKRGVMKYIAFPGQLELEIDHYCALQKIKSVLWPNMDTYDIQINFSDEEVWAIDAKAVRMPYFLKEKIRQDGGFPTGDYTKAFYVIPDEYADERTDYVDIINGELKKLGDKKVYCVSLRELKKKIREEVQIIAQYKKKVKTIL